MGRISGLSFCLFASLSAPAVSAALPQALLFLNKPVDSLCFFNLESNSDKISLGNCGAAKEKVRVKGHNASLLNRGFIGYDWQASGTSYPSQGSSYYKPFDAGDQAWWIYTLNNGGGSGDFTAINLVKREKPDVLSIKGVMGGDRCNGGIQDVTEKNHHLVFSVNLTAYDFLPLVQDNPHGLKAYDDLSACAVCCAAKAFYEVDANLEPKLSYVDFSGHGANPEEMPQQGVHQACFNTLFAAYVTKGKLKLNEQQLKQFVKEFNATCIPKS